MVSGAVQGAAVGAAVYSAVQRRRGGRNGARPDFFTGVIGALFGEADPLYGLPANLEEGRGFGDL